MTPNLETTAFRLGYAYRKGERIPRKQCDLCGRVVAHRGPPGLRAPVHHNCSPMPSAAEAEAR